MCPVKFSWTETALLTLLLACSRAAVALQVGGAIGVDTRYTSNAALVPVNESDDLITTGTVSASVREDQGALTGSARASARYLDYMDDTFGNQTYLQLGAGATWEQIRGVLSWNFNDYFSQSSVDNLAANVPSNTENINAFNLDAQLTLRPADRHTVTITPSFRDFYYETTGNDNQQTGIMADWSFQLRPTVSLSLAGSFTDVDYDNDTLGSGGASPDYSSTDASVGVTVLRSRSEFTAFVGVSKIERDSGEDTDGAIASLNAVYRLSGRSSVDAILSTDISDTSNAYLVTSLNPNTGNFGNIQTSNDVLRNSLARVAYNRSSTTVDFSTWIELRKLDYQTTSNDRKVQEYGARLGYGLSPRLRASISGMFVDTEEEVLNQSDKYYEADGQLDYDLSRKLNARAGVSFQNRDNTDPLRGDYDEYSIFAGLDYRLGANKGASGMRGVRGGYKSFP